ncbi:MAG TPA: type VI secretion system baseplate subunit TssE [Bryobacteraceae bacterium]|nr:type VI secretion system baseplate subunit TssE [Bryobacteraceae bacterium]
MARGAAERPVTVSVIDRLLDDEPAVAQEPIPTRSQSLRMLKNAVRRDIEWLLNTRPPVDPLPEGDSELRRSVYNYGLPDLVSLSSKSESNYAQVARMMENVLATFEPRLANIRVKVADAPADKPFTLRFIIEGMLRIDPAPEYIAFDTALELMSGEYEVRGENAQ